MMLSQRISLDVGLIEGCQIVMGDLVRIQLLGYHDVDLLVDGAVTEEGRTRQQIATKRVLTPLYQCSVAHAASVLPSALCSLYVTMVM